MRINAAGIDLIKEFEGCRLMPYNDIGGVLTVGYGHTGKDIVEGIAISREEAERILLEDISRFALGVSKACKGVVLTSNEFSALVCLAFNIGMSAFCDSTLLKKLTKVDFAFSQVDTEFLKWCKVRGKVTPGLLRRREAERVLFTTPDSV